MVPDASLHVLHIFGKQAMSPRTIGIAYSDQLHGIHCDALSSQAADMDEVTSTGKNEFNPYQLYWNHYEAIISQADRDEVNITGKHEEEFPGIDCTLPCGSPCGANKSLRPKPRFRMPTLMRCTFSPARPYVHASLAQPTPTSCIGYTATH